MLGFIPPTPISWGVHDSVQRGHRHLNSGGPLGSQWGRVSIPQRTTQRQQQISGDVCRVGEAFPSWAVGTGFYRQEDKWGTFAQIDTGEEKRRQVIKFSSKYFLNAILGAEHWARGDERTTSWPLMSSQPSGADRYTCGQCCWPGSEGGGPAISSLAYVRGSRGREPGKHTGPIYTQDNPC